MLNLISEKISINWDLRSLLRLEKFAPHCILFNVMLLLDQIVFSLHRIPEVAIPFFPFTAAFSYPDHNFWYHVNSLSNCSCRESSPKIINRSVSLFLELWLTSSFSLSRDRGRKEGIEEGRWVVIGGVLSLRDGGVESAVEYAWDTGFYLPS